MRFTIRDVLWLTATVAVGTWTVLVARASTGVFVWKAYATVGVLLFIALGLLINRKWGGLAGAGAAMALLLFLAIVVEILL